MKLRVAPDKTHFVDQNGKPFFYLADTMWSAFTNMTDAEWAHYLRLRAQQGFNVLQINILPQWDRCWVQAPYTPFPSDNCARFDFAGGMQQAYFDHAAALCQTAVEHGFVPALVVLWSNFVPGTWASAITAENVMPKELLAPYCQKVAETFGKFDPIYLLSGDTDLDSPEAVDYYRTVLAEMRRHCPDALMTMHIKGRYTELPRDLAEGIDFYMYQSGHNNNYPEKCYTMPGEFRAKYPRKPLLNGEPCYEQMGYSGRQYGRHDTFAARRAAWLSVVSGASAGVTYGAHGVWNWQKTGAAFNPVMGEGFDEAKPWPEALNFPGAWDYGYLKALLAQQGITALEPDDKVCNNTEEIRMGTAPDGSVSLVYLPANTKVRLRGDYTAASVQAVDMTTRRLAAPALHLRDGVTTVDLCPFEKDVLLVIRR